MNSDIESTNSTGGGARRADYSVFELMAIVLARDLRDGDQLQVGVGLPVVEAAVRLAHILHGPNMELIYFGVRMNVAHLAELPMPVFPWDRRAVRWAESYSDMGHRFDQVHTWHRRVFFVGGIQVDQFGNVNLIGIGEEHRRLKFRGPGSVGTASFTSHVGRYYIVVNKHTQRTFVERCDYISAVGWGDGGPDGRRKLGLPGGGPKYCISPLGVMDFSESDRRLRLHTLHPGVSLSELLANTGCELLIPTTLAETPAPSMRELEVLRERVDPKGALRKINSP